MKHNPSFCGPNLDLPPHPGCQSTPGWHYIFSRESLYKPLFTTVTGWAVDPSPTVIQQLRTSWNSKANQFFMVASIGWWTKSLHGKWLEITKHPGWCVLGSNSYRHTNIKLMRSHHLTSVRRYLSMLKWEAGRPRNWGFCLNDVLSRTSRPT